jgi:hypothetical protein
MKTRTIISALLLISLIPFTGSAQVGNLLKNKAAKVINAGAKTLGKEIDKEIDTLAQKKAEETSQKAWENAQQKQTEQAANTETNQGQTRQQSGAQGSGVNLGGLFGGKVTAKYNESYTFNNRMYMQMEIYDDKDVVKMDFYIYFSDSQPNAGFESKMVANSDEGNVTINSSSIFDGDNKVFILLTEMPNMKMGIISEVPDENTMQDQPDAKQVKPTITKTGNTRVIAGYKCDEYLYKDNETAEYGKMWVTKDLKLKGDNRVYSKAGLPGYFGVEELEGGAVLAMESYNEKNELEMKSETREINLGYDHKISTAGFSLRQMNFNQAGQKQ